MTYIVSGGALNSTHSLTHSRLLCSLQSCREWVTAHTYMTDPDGPTAFVSHFSSTRSITLEQRT